METPIEDMTEQPSIVGYADSVVVSSNVSSVKPVKTDNPFVKGRYVTANNGMYGTTQAFTGDKQYRIQGTRNDEIQLLDDNGNMWWWYEVSFSPVKPVTPKENPVYYIVTVENLANNTTREIKKYRGFYEKGYVTVGELLESYPRTVIWVNGEVMPMSYKIQQGDFVVRRHC